MLTFIGIALVLVIAVFLIYAATKPVRSAYGSYPTAQANWHLIRNQIIHS